MNDDWMDNPLEVDDFINSLEEETKDQKNGSDGRPPRGGGSGSGMLIVGAVLILIVIAILVMLFEKLG